MEVDSQLIGAYSRGTLLGTGGYSRVYAGTDTRTGAQVALKLLDKESIDKSKSSLKQVTREIEALSKIQSPHVLRLFDVDFDCVHTRTSTGKQEHVIMMALELAPGGELFDFLSYTGCFDEAVARAFFQQLIAGLGACHAAGIAHRDMKPENILLSQDFVLKIADFGFSIATDHRWTTECGTKSYMAPEITSRQPYEGPAVDIWACGVILFTALAGFPPVQIANNTDWWFHKLNTQQHSLFWQAHCRTAFFSQDAKDLINKMLEPNPAKRISLADILAHPWTTGGQTMSPQVLSAEMARRKAFIDAEKSKERLKDRAKHAGALSDVIDRGLEVDAFGQPVEHTPPPLFAAHAASLCDFRTAVAPAEALAAMAHVLRLREATADVQTFASEHRLTARVVTATAGVVEFGVQIFRESESASAGSAAGAEQAYVVQVKKVRGDAFAFRTLLSLLEHELTHAAFVDSTPESRLTADELSAFREATAQGSAF